VKVSVIPGGRPDGDAVESIAGGSWAEKTTERLKERPFPVNALLNSRAGGTHNPLLKQRK
jgi:hypothetical protein